MIRLGPPSIHKLLAQICEVKCFLSSISRLGVVSRAEMGTEAAYVNSYNMPVLTYHSCDRSLPSPLSAIYSRDSSQGLMTAIWL